ncbi:unnamed protein product, partial [Choristocarpus tenellus]
RYPECCGVVYRPSYADDGSYETPASPSRLSLPDHVLRLEHVHGYHNHGFYPATDTNVFYLGCNQGVRASATHFPNGRGQGSGLCEGSKNGFDIVYPAAALVVIHHFNTIGGQDDVVGVHEKNGGEFAGTDGMNQQLRNLEASVQHFFSGHNDDVTALAVHPGGSIVASGQVSALDFSHDGWLLCSVEADIKNTVSVWDWKKEDCLVRVPGGSGRINAFHFNPFQV